MQRLIFAIHNHQPVGNFGSVFQDAYDRCYRPVLDLAGDFPAVKLALHYTGPLLEWLETNQPAFLKDVRTLVERGQVEVLGGGFYEPMLAVLPDADARGQLTRMQEFCESHFGARPEGMWLAERVWDPDLPRVIAATGTKYTFLDDSHFFAAGLAKGQLSGHYVTEKTGKTLSVFPIDQQLRYIIPWKPVADVEQDFEALERTRGNDPRCLTYGDDGEKFGLWPGTAEWVFGKHWLRDFFKLLSERKELVTTVLPQQAMRDTPSAGRIYLPTASYEEMGEWALPAASMRPYAALKERLKSQGVYDEFQPFVRAGIWQGFFAKYLESNHIHKRVLQASERLRSLQAKLTKAPQQALLREAETQLYRSECNCAYWHGVFGGLYLNNVRHALFEALLKSERAMDLAQRGEKPFLTVETSDFDADLQDEVTVRSDRLVAIVSPAQGGSLIELSDLPRAYALTDVLARREEGYHDKLRKLAAETRATEAGNDPPSNGNDQTTAKEPNLDRFLVVDGYRRSSFIDRFYAPEFSLDALRAGHDGDLGSHSTAAYALTGVPDGDGASFDLTLTHDGMVGSAGQPVRLEKHYLFTRGRAGFDVRYRLTNLGDAQLKVSFAPELNFTMLAGDAEDRSIDAGNRRERLRYRGEVKELRQVSMSDGWAKLRLTIATERPFDLWAYPIETVSQSEGGFERTYQGSCLLLRTPIELAARAGIDLLYKVDLEHP